MSTNPTRGRRAFTPDQVAAIRQMYARGESQAGIARMFRVNSQTIGRLLRGDTYITATPDGTRAPVAEMFRQQALPVTAEEAAEANARIIARARAEGWNGEIAQIPMGPEGAALGGVSTEPPDDRKRILLTGLPPTAKRFTRDMYSDQDVVFIDDDPPEESDSQNQLTHPPETE